MAASNLNIPEAPAIDGCDPPAQRQGARPLRAARRPPADGRERPHLGVRLRPRRRPSPTRARSSPGCRCGGSTSSPTSCRTTSSPPTSPTSVARSGGGVRAAGHVPGRVRRPRLPDRLGPRSSTSAAARSAASRCPPGSSTAAGCPSRSSPRRPRRRSATTTRTSTSSPWPSTVGDGRRRRAARCSPSRSTAGRGDRPRARHHPGRHQVRVRPPGRRHDRARRRGADARLVPLLAGRRRGSRAAPQPSYDKQFVRDWLTSPESGWDRASGEAPPAAARRGRRAHARPLRRGLRAPHRPVLVTGGT